MIYTHNIHPVMVSIGSIDLYWYGAMYAISFLLIDYMMKREIVINTEYKLDKKIFIPNANPILKTDGLWYQVRRGDTVSEIAVSHKTTVGKLVLANNLHFVSAPSRSYTTSDARIKENP